MAAPAHPACAQDEQLDVRVAVFPVSWTLASLPEELDVRVAKPGELDACVATGRAGRARRCVPGELDACVATGRAGRARRCAPAAVGSAWFAFRCVLRRGRVIKPHLHVERDHSRAVLACTPAKPICASARISSQTSSWVEILPESAIVPRSRVTRAACTPLPVSAPAEPFGRAVGFFGARRHLDDTWGASTGAAGREGSVRTPTPSRPSNNHIDGAGAPFAAPH